MGLKANHTHSRFALHRCLDQRCAFDAEASTQFQGNVAFLYQLFCYVRCGVIRLTPTTVSVMIGVSTTAWCFLGSASGATKMKAAFSDMNFLLR